MDEPSSVGGVDFVDHPGGVVGLEIEDDRGHEDEDGGQAGVPGSGLDGAGLSGEKVVSS